MKKALATGAALMLTTSMGHALGLDRSSQDIDLIFEDGNYAMLSFGSTMPSVSGTDEPVFGGFASGEVAEDYTQVGAGVKYQVNPQLSMTLIYDQPYGVDVDYPVFDGTPGSGSTALGGTAAMVDSSAISFIARYEFNPNFSVHAGIRRQTIEADVTLAGAAYGALSGYNASFDSESEVGYLVGAAYERPDIALRVALTYFSEMTYELNTVESVGGVVVNPGSLTEIKTPQAINLDFQTGIAQDTLLFGSVRWADYETLIVSPAFFDANVDPADSGSSLTDIESKAEYSIGVGRRFNDQFSASIAVGYEPESDDDLVSPLSPTNGNTSLTLAGQYNVNDQVTISGGVRYTWVGDAQPETGTPDTARASFTDNDAVSIGLRVGFSF